MTISVVEEATTSSAGDNRACSNRRDRENECGSGKRARSGTEYRGSSKTGLLCYGDRQGKKLLYLWGIQAYGLSL